MWQSKLSAGSCLDQKHRLRPSTTTRASEHSYSCIKITGAASDIGLAMAKVLYSRGASLSLVDLKLEDLDKVIDSIKSGSKDGDQQITTHAVDVRNRSDVDSWIRATIRDHGTLDGAANVAGVLGSFSNIADMSDENWELVMGVNAGGV